MLDWQGRTAVCIASGPSLTVEDCERVRGLPAIVTNTTFRLCLWADALFGFDLKWWRMYIDEVRATFHGKRYTASMLAAAKFGAEYYGGPRNSGACALAVAMSVGAKRVVLLGYDAALDHGRTHWHGDHPAGLENAGTVSLWPDHFRVLAKRAERKGIEVLNASRRTALTCFPRVELEAVL